MLVQVLVAVAVSTAVDRAARGRADAARARAESDALTAFAHAVLAGHDSVDDLLEELRRSFALDGVDLVQRQGPPEVFDQAVPPPPVLAAVGEGTDDPARVCAVVDVDAHVALRLAGPRLRAGEVRVVAALATQVAAALERDRLRAEARAARAEKERTRTRTALLRAVSHDLRTPLAGIKAGVSALRSDDIPLTPEDRAALLGDVDASTDRLQQLIDNLLDMSRLDAGAVVPRREATALEDVVGAGPVRGAVRPGAGGRPRRPAAAAPGRRPARAGAGQRGGERRPPRRRGPGPAHGPGGGRRGRGHGGGRRGGGPRRRPRPGGRAGPAGGDVRALPARSATAAARAWAWAWPSRAGWPRCPAARWRPRRPPAAGSPWCSGCRCPGRRVSRVLVVEDDPALSRALGITLRSQQHEVRTVASGAEAVAEAARWVPELVVLDLGLPDMDGTEVLRALRAWTRVPVVVLSARQTSDDKVEALDAGADDYVTKPFGMDELLARLRAAVRRGEQQPSAPVVRTASFTVDLARRLVTDADGRPSR